MRRDDRLKLLRRAILETAIYLKRDLTADQVEEILHEFDRRGRPTKRGYTQEESERFGRMDALLTSGAERTVTAAAKRVARELPGHSESATYDWLRKHYRNYRTSKVSGPSLNPKATVPTVAEIERAAERHRRARGLRRAP